MVVFPAHSGRQGHEDALDAPSRFQAEERSAVVNEIELHVATSADFLPLLLLGRVFHADASHKNGDVCADETGADVLHKCEQLVQGGGFIWA